MAIVEFISEDYLEEARENITQQFVDKDVIDRYLQLLLKQQEAIQQVFKDLLQKRSIDEATGVQLDIIGEIVGQPRELISADLFDFFGFQGAINAGSFGEIESPSVGSRWYDFGQPIGGNVLLDDSTYRLFIKAKILKNTTASTPEEFITFTNFMFGTSSTLYIDEGQASYTVLFGRELSIFEQALLNYVSTSQGYPSRLIPKTVGVRVNFGSFSAGNYFGFQGAPGAKGFGDDPRVYTGGYGSAYGQAYGRSANDEINTYDGLITYDGSLTYVGEREIIPDLEVGGIFANLF